MLRESEEDKLKYTDVELAKIGLEQLQYIKSLVVGKRFSVDLADELINKGFDIEINGEPVNDVNRDFDGTDDDIEWIRIEYYKNLDYIYLRRGTDWTEFVRDDNISFDLVNEYMDGLKEEYAKNKFDGITEKDLEDFIAEHESDDRSVVVGGTWDFIVREPHGGDEIEEPGDKIPHGEKNTRKVKFNSVYEAMKALTESRINVITGQPFRNFKGWNFNVWFEDKDEDKEFVCWFETDVNENGKIGWAKGVDEDMVDENGVRWYFYEVTVPFEFSMTKEDFVKELKNACNELGIESEITN